MFKKIVITGPESTGKTVLCKSLAEHFKSDWVPEYAREFLLKNGSAYKYENLYEIALGQIKAEEETLNSTLLPDLKFQPIFIDTDLHVIKVWSEFVFNKCDNRILNAIAMRYCDLYLLCNVDLPWVKDELREHPDLESREILYHYYKETMINQSVPWIEINGNYEQRLQKAIASVNGLFQ